MKSQKIEYFSKTLLFEFAKFLLIKVFCLDEINKTKVMIFPAILTLPWLFFSPLPLIFARSVLWVCHVDSPQIENPSNLSNFLSVQLLNHDFKKKSFWEPPAVTMKNIILIIQISLYPRVIFTPNVLRFSGVWWYCSSDRSEGFLPRDIIIKQK